MNKNHQIFEDFNSFLLTIRGIDPRMFEYGISFNLKIFGLREMHLRTLDKAKELEEAQKRESVQAKSVLESGAVFFAKDTDKAYKDTIAYFEAYLNALYSLLQVITRISYLLYQTQGKPLPFEWDRITFGDLKSHFEQKPSHDPDFSSYVSQKMSWYSSFKNNRHKITHNGSALLLFTQMAK